MTIAKVPASVTWEVAGLHGSGPGRAIEPRIRWGAHIADPCAVRSRQRHEKVVRAIIGGKE